MSGDDWLDDPDARAWARRVRKELVPMIRDSTVTISLVPTGDADVKFAVELGMAIMLGKPIILVVAPGTQVPDKLVLVADEIVERGDEHHLRDAIERVIGE
jgi:nucleoside 2-deoxyribosyltransferase